MGARTAGVAGGRVDGLLVGAKGAALARRARVLRGTGAGGALIAAGLADVALEPARLAGLLRSHAGPRNLEAGRGGDALALRLRGRVRSGGAELARLVVLVGLELARAAEVAERGGRGVGVGTGLAGQALQTLLAADVGAGLARQAGRAARVGLGVSRLARRAGDLAGEMRGGAGLAVGARDLLERRVERARRALLALALAGQRLRGAGRAIVAERRTRGVGELTRLKPNTKRSAQNSNN